MSPNCVVTMDYMAIPTTARESKYLLMHMGYESLEQFADSLPNNAYVADIGAGLSRLGHDVAAMRPDIRWVNIDPSYDLTHIYKLAEKDMPENLSLLSASVFEEGRDVAAMSGQLDLVFSYWLLPHLSIDDWGEAKKAVAAMFSLLNSTGMLKIGPVRTRSSIIPFMYRYEGVRVWNKSEQSEISVNEVVRATELSPLLKLVHRFLNKHSILLLAKHRGAIEK